MPLVFLGSWTLALQIVFWIYSLLIFYNGARRYLEIPKSPVAVGFLCVLAIALPLALGGLVVLILNGVLFFLVDTFY